MIHQLKWISLVAGVDVETINDSPAVLLVTAIGELVLVLGVTKMSESSVTAGAWITTKV